MNTEKKAYTLSVLVEDTPGVLSQVARLFSRKGYNIESICSGPGLEEGTTRISVVTIVDKVTVHQIATQLSKLLLVISVDVLEGEGTADGHPVKKGDHFILPAGYGDCSVTGRLSLITSHV